MTDAINPSHYKHLPAEAIDIIEAAIAKAPSNEAAYLHGQALKYLLRCWHKNGIEDLGKAKWYLDRLVASFDEVLAEINAPVLEGAGEQPKPSKEQPPSGYRMLGDAKVEPRYTDDLYWSDSHKHWTPIGFQMSYANQHNWAACRKIDEPPKHRTPTLEDLANGPIECEVRQGNLDAWEKRTLIYVFSEYGFPFVCAWASQGGISRWSQCRIEVQE